MINKLLSRQFVVYSIIGCTGITLDFICYALLLGTGMHPSIATMISVSVGITNNFVLNAHFNFKKTDNFLKRFVSFYTVGIVGIFLSAFIIWLLHDIAKIDPFLAKLASLPFILVSQYILNIKVTFKDTANEI